MSRKWKNGIFGCFNDCSICILSFLVPCYIAGRNARGVGRSCLIFGCLSMYEPIGCIVRSVIRQDIRSKNNIEGNLCYDMLCHTFCCCCALAQEAQELGQTTVMSRC